MRSNVALAAICLLGLGLRLWGIAFGLPDVHHPDEMTILNTSLSFAKGDLSPHLFLYPTLYYYALFVWEGLFFAAGRLFGLFQSVSDFERSFFLDPSRLVLAGRTLTALFGVATLPAVHAFGARLYGRAVGLGAALFLAVAPFAVRDAHYIKHDVPVTLFIVLAQLGAARLVVDSAAASRRRGWLFAGAMAGLAMSTHYYAFLVVVPILAAAIGRVRGEGELRPVLVQLVWAGVAAIAAFAVTSPFFFRELGVVVRDMTAVREIDIDRAVNGRGAFQYFGTYVRMLWSDAVGWPVCLAAGIGVVIALMRDWRRGLLLASFPVAFLLFLSNTVPMTRYMNAMLPSIAVAAAFAINDLGGRFTKNVKRPPRSFFFLAAAVPALLLSLRADEFYRQKDTRTLAREFIEQTVAAGSSILVQPHSVQLPQTRDGLLEALRAHLGSETGAAIKFQKQLKALADAPDNRPRFRTVYLGETTDGGFDPDKIYVSPAVFTAAAGLQPLRDARVAYVAVNQYNIGHPAFDPLQAALVREGRLLATFSPYRAEVSPDRRAAVAPFFHNTADRIDPALERPGPTIEIWRVKQ